MVRPVENRGRPKDASKRDAILNAARDLFMANGYAATSMDNLAAAANVSKATLYSHFADKDALYQAIVEAKVQDYRLEDFGDRLCGDMADDLQLIGESLQALIYDEQAIHMLRMVISEAVHKSPIVELFEATGPKKVFQRIVEYFAEHAKRDAQFGFDPEKEAELFTSLIMGHRRFIQVLMGVRQAPNENERREVARLAVSQYLQFCRDRISTD